MYEYIENERVLKIINNLEYRYIMEMWDNETKWNRKIGENVFEIMNQNHGVEFHYPSRWRIVDKEKLFRTVMEYDNG